MKNHVYLKLSKSQRSFKDKVTPKKKDRKLCIEKLKVMQKIISTQKQGISNVSSFPLYSIFRSLSYQQKKDKVEFPWLVQPQFNNVTKANFCCFKLPSGFKLIISQVLSYLDFCDYKRESFKLVELQTCCFILFPLKKI